MKRIIVMVATVCIMVSVSYSQNKSDKGTNSKYKLSSDALDKDGKSLDVQINELSSKIANIVKKYDLLNTKGIRFLPFQTTYKLGQDFIELEKHSFVKSGMLGGEITGIKTKKMKIYTTGSTVSKIESEIYEKDYYSGETDFVKIVDPSPTTEGTDDILFTHVKKGKNYLDEKPMGKIKNTTAFPLRNEIKRNFLVPHLSYFRNSFLFVSEAYYKSLKDADGALADFLKKSTKY